MATYTGTDDDVLGEGDAPVRAPFLELGRNILGRFALAYSTATVERTFSIVNHVKNKTRNRLQTSTLDAIVRVREFLNNRNVCCHNFEISQGMLQKFTADMYKNPADGGDVVDQGQEEDEPMAIDEALG